MTSEIEYDCSPWAGETRRILRSVLDDTGIPHAWEGTVLVVPDEHEDRVDTIIEEVQSTARPSLGTARDQVGFDVSPWSAATINELVDRLVQDTIPHEWDAEGDLMVHAEDSDTVEDILDGLGDPDGDGEMDGLELHERLGKLFVATDRLSGNPGDQVGLREIEAAYASIESAPLPYGVDTRTWLDLHSAARRLVALAIGEEPDEDDPADDAPSSDSALTADAALSTESGTPAGETDDLEDDIVGGSQPTPTDDASDLFDESADPVQESARALRDLLRRFV